VSSGVLLSLLSEKALLSLQTKHGNLLARQAGRAEKISASPLAVHNDNASFERYEIAKMQEATVDSRLCGNDSSHPKGLKALCEQTLRSPNWAVHWGELSPGRMPGIFSPVCLLVLSAGQGIKKASQVHLRGF
jgi:hypothetical protein